MKEAALFLLGPLTVLAVGIFVFVLVCVCLWIVEEKLGVEW